MMPTYVGDTQPDAYYIGRHLVSRKYRGRELVYQRNPPASVGARVAADDTGINGTGTSGLFVRASGNSREYWYTQTSFADGSVAIHTFNISNLGLKGSDSNPLTVNQGQSGQLASTFVTGLAADASHIYVALGSAGGDGRIDRYNRSNFGNRRPVTASHATPHALAIARGRVLSLEAAQGGSAQIRAYSTEMDPDPSLVVPVDVNTHWTFNPPAFGLAASNTHVLVSAFEQGSPISTGNNDVLSFDYAGRRDGTSTLPALTGVDRYGATASQGDRFWVEVRETAETVLHAFEFNPGG